MDESSAAAVRTVQEDRVLSVDGSGEASLTISSDSCTLGLFSSNFSMSYEGNITSSSSCSSSIEGDRLNVGDGGEENGLRDSVEGDRSLGRSMEALIDNSGSSM